MAIFGRPNDTNDPPRGACQPTYPTGLVAGSKRPEKGRVYGKVRVDRPKGSGSNDATMDTSGESATTKATWDIQYREQDVQGRFYRALDTQATWLPRYASFAGEGDSETDPGLQQPAEPPATSGLAALKVPPKKRIRPAYLRRLCATGYAVGE